MGHAEACRPAHNSPKELRLTNPATTKGQTDRAAGPSIRGYTYQFDLTILKILESAENELITIEGREDIDVSSPDGLESIQCKYHESAKYSITDIRKPLLAMLRSFVSGKNWSYTLYVHYPDMNEVPHVLNVASIKSALTENKRKPAQTILHYQEFSDHHIYEFATKFKIIRGEAFLQQRKTVLAALNSAIRSGGDDARDLYYGNALACVVDIAIRPEERDRRLTRSSFIQMINTKPVLFDRWQREHLGKEKYVRKTQLLIKRSSLLSPAKRRVLVLDASAERINSSGLHEILETLCHEMYSQKAMSSSKPFTVILEGTEDEVRNAKRRLIARNIRFNDGFEDLEFNQRLFEELPIYNLKPRSTTVEKISYYLRIISADTYQKNAPDLENPSTLISFGSRDPSVYGGHDATFCSQMPTLSASEILTFLKGLQ